MILNILHGEFATKRIEKNFTAN